VVYSAVLDREAIREELRRVFDEATTDVLVDVLGRVMAYLREVELARQDFESLRSILSELADAQRRTEEELHRLAEAQGRTEERLNGLAGEGE